MRRAALALLAVTAALAGCGGSKATSLRDYCSHHGGGPGRNFQIDPDAKFATVVCGDGRLRTLDGKYRP